MVVAEVARLRGALHMARILANSATGWRIRLQAGEFGYLLLAHSATTGRRDDKIKYKACSMLAGCFIIAHYANGKLKQKEPRIARISRIRSRLSSQFWEPALPGQNIRDIRVIRGSSLPGFSV